MPKKVNITIVLAICGVLFSFFGGENAEPDGEVSASIKSSSLKGASHLLFDKSPDLVRLAIWSPGESGLDVVTREGSNGKIYQWQKGVTIPFVLEDVSCRHADEIYLAGVEDNGAHIIMRIVLHPADGAMASQHPIEVDGIGLPTALLETEVSLNGDVFVPPSERPIPIPPNRKIVFRATGFGGFRSVVPDPEGRFLLAQEDTTGSVYQIDTVGESSLLVSANDYPLMKEGMLQYPIQLGTSERVYLIGDHVLSALDGWVLLQDVDNDGVFESPALVSWEEKKDFFPMTPDGGSWQTVTR